MTSPSAVGTPSTATPATEQGSRHLGLALFVISIAQLMVVLDATIVNVALPSIQNDLGFSGAGLEWVVTAYTLTFGGLLLLGGRMGDILGRRRMFVTGVAVFTVASLLGGFATTQWWLLSARGLQGIGAAIMAPTALSLVTTNFPEGRPRNRAMGIYAAMSGAGAAIGLITGGLLTDYASWRWVLFVNVPIGIVCALAAPYALVESERRRGRFDLPGALSATAGVMLLVYGLTHASPTQDKAGSYVSHWGDPLTVGTLVLSAVLLTAFVVIEMRSRHALMPLHIFSNLSRSGAYLVSLCIGTAMFGIFFFLTIFVQRVWDYSPLRTGVAFLPISAGIVFFAGLSSQLVARLGARALMLPGSLLSAVGMFWLSRIDVGSGYVGGLLGPMLVTAAGLGLVFVPLTLVAVAGVDNEEAGLASGLLNTGQQIGGSIGLAVLGTVVFTAIAGDTGSAFREAAAAYGQPVDAHHPPAAVVKSASSIALSHGVQVGFLVAAGIAVLAFLVTLATVRVRREQLQEAGAVPVG